MKYTKEIVDKMMADYNGGDGKSVDDIAAELDVPARSVIAKLSSLGVYKKKVYLNKQGVPPVKKEEYISRLAGLLKVHEDLLESLEKVNKNVLILLEKALAKDE